MSLKGEMETFGPAIECVNLSKDYGKETVLENINIQVKRGEIAALIGPMGAGKTTLLKILTTLILPSKGEAFILQKNIISDNYVIRKKIGFVSSEERSFYWRLTGLQNLNFFASLYRMEKKLRQQRIESLFDQFGLIDKKDIKFNKYSTGAKQTLNLIRCLVHDPQVLLLDEPTRSLSSDRAKLVFEFLRASAKKEGKTILFASHNLDDVSSFADRIIILDKGKIKADGALPDLVSKSGINDSRDLSHLYEHYCNQGENR